MGDPIAAHLRARRHARGLTLQQVAERAGMQLQNVSVIELGDQDPRLGTLRRLVEALGLRLALLDEDGQEWVS